MQFQKTLIREYYASTCLAGAVSTARTVCGLAGLRRRHARRADQGRAWADTCGNCRRYPGDDGSADTRVRAALDAYAAGRGSEHAVLTALAGSRLLVPVVALLTEAEHAARTGCAGSRPVRWPCRP